MAALTWREVSAPNFGGVSQALSTAGQLLGNATQGMSQGLTAFQKAGEDQAASQFMLNEMRRQDPNGFNQLMGGVDPTNLTPTAIKSAVDAQGAMAQAGLRRQQTQDAAAAATRLAADNRALDAARGPQAAINEALMRGDIPAAQALYSQAAPAFAGMPVDKQREQAAGFASLGTNATNMAQGSAKEKRSVAAAELSNYIFSAAAAPDERQQLLNEYGQRKDADPRVLAEVTEQMRKAGLLDEGGATGGTGSGGGAKGTTKAKGGAVGKGGGGSGKVDISGLTAKSSIASAINDLSQADRDYMAETDRLIGAPEGTTAAQLYQESKFDGAAVSKAGARGYAQLMPATQATLEARWGRKIDPANLGDAMQAHRELMLENVQKFGNVDDALRAYNGGWDKSKWSNDETAGYGTSIAAHRDALAGANTAGARGMPSLAATIAPGTNVLSPEQERLQTGFVTRAMDAQQSRNAASGIESRLDSARKSDKTAVEVANQAVGKEGAFSGANREEVASLITDFMKETGLENASVAYEVLNASYDGDTRGRFTRALAWLNPMDNNTRWGFDMNKAKELAASVKDGTMDLRAGARDAAALDRKNVADAQTEYDEARQARIAAEARVANQPNANQFLPKYQEKEKRKYEALQAAKKKEMENESNYRRREEQLAAQRAKREAPAAADRAVSVAQASLDKYLEENQGKPVQGDQQYLRLKAELVRAARLRNELK